MTDLIREYEQGKSPISDEEYDAFYAEEGESLGTKGDVTHLQPLTSLRKYFVGEGNPPKLEGETIEMLKLDGLALSLLYVRGTLVSAATRGDGKSGQDVTEKIRASGRVPTLLDGSPETLQVDGEFLCPSEFPNARNIATGALVHLQSVDEFLSRVKEYKMSFIAYRVGVGYNHSFVTDMDMLRKLGFNVALDASADTWPCDGKVIRLLDNDTFYASGITGNCTNGGYAVKTRKESVKTILKDIVWQTSPKGRVTPVGILEPIEIDGAMVGKVTLNNVNFIRKANIRYGATVGVIRAGDIIPRIMSCEGGEDEVAIPDCCPSCEGELEFDDTYLTCVNVDCPAQCAKLTSHFFSTLGVKGFGIKTSEKFGMLPAEILKLPLSTYSDIIGTTVGKKLYDQVTKLKDGVTKEDLLVAMSIPSVGKNTSPKLPELDKWPEAIDSANIGEASKEKIWAWYTSTFEEIWNSEWPLPTFSSAKPTAISNGKKVCVTGKVAGHTRDSLHARLIELGLTPVSTVTSKVDYLLCEQQSTSSSYTKAQSLNIPIVTLKALEDLFQ